MMISVSGDDCFPCEIQQSPEHDANVVFKPPRQLRLPAWPRHFTLLIAFCLCPALGAAAQNSVFPLLTPSPADSISSISSSSDSFPPSPPQLGASTVHAGFATGQWQIADGYQYNRIYLRGSFAPFDTNGFNASVTRFFGRQVGVEGDLGAGFAPATPGISASSFFFGGGPHISFRGRTRIEPWIHGLAGVQHFDFGGVAFSAKTTSLAWTAGGGVDYRFNSGFALRFQVDYLGTHFAGAFQRDLQIVTGVAWNF